MQFGHCFTWYLIILFGLFPASAFADTRAQVRIGVIAPLSGNVAHFGTAIVNGMSVAAEESENKLRTVEIVYEDDQYDPKHSIAAFRKLQAKGVSLIYVSGVAPSEAVAPLAEQGKVPVILNCQSPEPARKRRFVFRFVNSTRDFVAPLWRHFRRRGWKSIVLVETEAPYIRAYSDALNAQREGDERVVTIGTVSPGTNDFRALITKLKGARADGVGALLFPGQVRAFYRQASELGAQAPAFGTDVLESEIELKAAGPSIEGTVFAANHIDRNFATKYRARFGNTEQLSSAANGYDFILFTAALADRGIKWSEPEAVLEAIRSTQPPMGALGSSTFSDTPESGQQFSFPVELKVVDDGTFRPLTD